jgi:hypothetical protein
MAKEAKARSYDWLGLAATNSFMSCCSSRRPAAGGQQQEAHVSMRDARLEASRSSRFKVRQVRYPRAAPTQRHAQGLK